MTDRFARPSRRPRPLAGFYVLVVDHDSEARELFRLVLAYYGAAVTIASTSGAALQAFQRHVPDVVLTDVMLGRAEDGMWLIREAHSSWPWVPFVAISGEDVPADVLTTSGFVTYLRKPVTPGLLVNAVLGAIVHPAIPPVD